VHDKIELENRIGLGYGTLGLHNGKLFYVGGKGYHSYLPIEERVPTQNHNV
jgi:hypothetical protein